MTFALTPGLRVETVDGAHLVLVPGRNEVLRLTGLEAEAFTRARAETADVPDHLVPAMAGLVEAGIVTSDTWTRRTVLRLGGAVAAAGIATIALPGVAAAASPPTSPDATAAPTTTVATVPPGTLYLSESYNRRVIKVTPSGEQSDVATDLGWPKAVALDAAGNLYVALALPAQVIEITPSGEQSIVADGLGNPSGIALDAAGKLYIADSYGQVLAVAPGGVPVTFAGGLDGAEGVAVDPAGNVYVSETNACRVVVIAPDGQRRFIEFAWAFEYPYGIAVDSTGTLYVLLGNGDLVSIAPGGARATIATGFWDPWGIMVDAADDVYIADSYNARVVKYTPGGSVVEVFNEDGVYPNGVAVV